MYYLDDEASFPSEPREKQGRWAGVAENMGDTLTYIIVSDDTEKAVYRSILCPVTEEDVNVTTERYAKSKTVFFILFFFFLILYIFV